MATRIGVFIFDGAEELDFVGPWEIFTASSTIAAPPERVFAYLDDYRNLATVYGQLKLDPLDGVVRGLGAKQRESVLAEFAKK